jgi:hypothetical protein
MDYWPALLAADQLDHHVVLDDGTRIEVPAPSRTATPEELAQPVHPEPSLPAPDGPVVELGELAHARAGDEAGTPTSGSGCPTPRTGTGCGPR